MSLRMGVYGAGGDLKGGVRLGLVVLGVRDGEGGVCGWGFGMDGGSRRRVWVEYVEGVG